MNSRLFLNFIQMLLVVMLASCASNTQKIFSDYDKEQDFSNYQKFSWISEEPMIVSGDIGPSPLDARKIKEAIIHALENKGYRFVEDPDKADFVVSFTVGARDKLDLRSRNVYYFGPHWRWGYSYYGEHDFIAKEITVREYSEGSLSIDIYDVQRKSPIWHANASKRLTKAELRGENDESIKKAAIDILKDFPPQ